MWSRLPITAANFIIEVEFKISGESTHLFGDGLAVWITKGRAQPGPVFGNVGQLFGPILHMDGELSILGLGELDKFEGLGVFLDT